MNKCLPYKLLHIFTLALCYLRLRLSPKEPYGWQQVRRALISVYPFVLSRNCWVHHSKVIATVLESLVVSVLMRP